MLNYLWIAIVALGGLVLVAVLTYNEWQARRYVIRKPDPAIEGQMQHAANDADQAGIERVLPANLVGTVATEVQHPSVPVRMRLDERLDAIAYIHLRRGAKIEGRAVLHSMPASLMAYDKPCAIEGCIYNSDNDWQPILSSMYYSAFRIGVQLANQHGPISEISFREFERLVQTFAGQEVIARSTISWPDIAQAIQQGHKLDKFANDHDVQLHFTVHADSGVLWSVAYLLQQARLQGFVPSAIPGELVLSAERDKNITLLTLKFDPEAAQQPNLEEAVVDEFELNMALSAIPASADPVLHIYTIASTMSKVMGGLVVDNAQKRRVGDDTLGDLMQRLGQLYKQMDEAGFPAGSVLLQRLLS